MKIVLNLLFCLACLFAFSPTASAEGDENSCKHKFTLKDRTHYSKGTMEAAAEYCKRLIDNKCGTGTRDNFSFDIITFPGQRYKASCSATCEITMPSCSPKKVGPNECNKLVPVTKKVERMIDPQFAAIVCEQKLRTTCAPSQLVNQKIDKLKGINNHYSYELTCSGDCNVRVKTCSEPDDGEFSDGELEYILFGDDSHVIY